METRSEKYANVDKQPIVDNDWKKECELLKAQISEMRLQHEDELLRRNEEWMKRMAEQDERRVNEIKKLRDDLHFKEEIIKSVLHIRG